MLIETGTPTPDVAPETMPQQQPGAMRQFVSNTSYLLMSHVGRIGSQLIGVSIIARLLTPADFGTVAIAMVVSNLAGLLRDLGTGPAAIRSRDATPSFLGGIYTVQLTISMILAAAICVAAPLLATFYRTESLRSVLFAFSVVFPISALGSVHLIVLERNQRYRAISIIELASYVAGLTAAAATAYLGFGVLSLAFQAVVNAAVQTVLVRSVAGVAIEPEHPKHARSAASGSAAVTSFHLFNYVARNLDAAVAGRLATAGFVGSYSMATRIAQLPSQAIGMLLSRASIPMLSRAGQTRAELTRNICGVIDLAVWGSAGVCLLLASLRTSVTAVLFGPQWLSTVPAQLSYLLPAAALISVAAVLVGIMTALGAGRALTAVGALTAAAHVCILSVCLRISPSLLPLAAFASGTAAFTFAASALVLMLRELEIDVMSAWRALPIVVVLTYPGTQLVLDRMMPAATRSIGREVVEGSIVSASFLVVIALLFLPLSRRTAQLDR
jgi:O-antigen/teichoic acid export membrane protein